MPGPVLIDTDVFSRVFVQSASRAAVADPEAENWRRALSGRSVLISFQTRAEVLQGAIARKWGERRYLELREMLDRTPTVGVDNHVIDAHATLFAECRHVGHALHAKDHTGDRWVAACAIAKGIPLLAGDGIYHGAPRLELVN